MLTPPPKSMIPFPCPVSPATTSIDSDIQRTVLSYAILRYIVETQACRVLSVRGKQETAGCKGSSETLHRAAGWPRGILQVAPRFPVRPVQAWRHRDV